jgi:hypothetical protein
LEYAKKRHKRTKNQNPASSKQQHNLPERINKKVKTSPEKIGKCELARAKKL